MSSSSGSERDIELEREDGNRLGSSRRDKGYCVPSFISKTYEILEKEQHEDIIAWGESGYNFYVKNIKEFEEKILPIYFRHKNFASFVRQLNMYDFHKIRGEQKHIFEHKLFRKGSQCLLQDIKRKCFKKLRDDYQGDDVQVEIEESRPKRNLPVYPLNSLHKEDHSRRLKIVLEKEREKQQAFETMTEQRLKSRKRDLQLMEQIVSKLREVNPQSQKEIRQQINTIKIDPRYQSLRGKCHIYEIFKKVRESLYEVRPRNTVEDLDQLSIEEEILFNQIEKPAKVQITSITNFETENFMKSSHHTIKHIYGEEFFSKEMF